MRVPMFSIVVSLVVSASALFVYLDASANRIGKVSNQVGMFNMSAGAWALATLFLWAVAFPAYVLKRGALIAQAKANPVEPPRRMVKASTIAAAGMALTALSAIPYVRGTLPSCDSPNVVALAEKIVRDAPLVRTSGLAIKGITLPVEQEYDRTEEARVCRGILEHARGEEGIRYTVEWHDQSKGVIWVRILPM